MFDQLPTNTHYVNRYIKFIDKCRYIHTGYVEIHHIVPRSFGGTNDPSNLIALSAREHFIAHWILSKCFSECDQRNKMAFAFWNMCGRSKLNRNSTTYQLARERFAILNSELKTGFKHTPEVCAIISAAHKGRKQTAEHIKNRFNSREGFRHSDDTKQRLSEINRGKKLSPETLSKVRAHAERRRGVAMDRDVVERSAAARKGSKRTNESRERMSKAQAARYNDPCIYTDHEGITHRFDRKSDCFLYLRSNPDPRFSTPSHRSNFYAKVLRNPDIPYVQLNRDILP